MELCRNFEEELIAWRESAIDGWRREWQCPKCKCGTTVKDHGQVWSRGGCLGDILAYRYEVRCKNSTCSLDTDVLGRGWKVYSDVDVDMIERLDYKMGVDHRNAQMSIDVRQWLTRMKNEEVCYGEEEG